MPGALKRLARHGILGRAAPSAQVHTPGPCSEPGGAEVRWLPCEPSVLAEWEALADRLEAEPPLHPGWLRAWSNAFADGRLDVLALHRGATLAAILPVRRSGGVVRSPTNWHTVAFGPLAVDAAAAGALAEALVATVRPRRSRTPSDKVLLGGLRAHRIDFAFVDAGSPFAEALATAAAAAGCRLLTRTLARSPYIAIDGDWESYERSLRPQLTREIRRRRRRLEELGPVTLEVDRGGRDLEERLDDALRIEAAGWKGARGTAIASTPETRSFYAELARWAARRGCLRLAFLRAGTTRLAVDLACETARSHFLVKTGYDAAYRTFSPGTLLRYEMVKRAFELGLETYEFLGVADPWKLEWTALARERIRVQAFAPTPAGRIDALAFRYGRPGAKALLAPLEARRR